MSPQRLKQLSVCVLASGLITFAAVALDSQRAGVHQTVSGLNWARQIASQTEGLVFKAKESGEKNPLDWAVNSLSQGADSRLVHVSRAHGPSSGDSGTQEPESFSLDREQGIFEYTRIFAPQDGAGVHVQLRLGYEGFLGSRSVAASDLLGLAVFAACFALVFLKTGKFFGFDDTSLLRALVTQWVGGAKAQLTRHGVHVREMVRQSQRLAFSSARSRELVGELRAKIHDGLSELHESREFYQGGETIAARAETLALNMAIEANRLGGDARRIADMASELHRQIQALHSVNRKGQDLVSRLERRVEPWSTDADLAFHAFDEIKGATDLLSQHIRGTTETLLGQAKLIQGLNRELGVGAAPGSRATSQSIAVPAAAMPESTATLKPAEIETPVENEKSQLPAPQNHRLPEPLPPLTNKESTPLFRRLRAKKSA